MTLIPMNAAQSQQCQQLLSTEEWVDLNNRDEKPSVYYLRGVVDTLGAIGNFTCKSPVVFGRHLMRRAATSFSLCASERFRPLQPLRIRWESM